MKYSFYPFKINICTIPLLTTLLTAGKYQIDNKLTKVKGSAINTNFQQLKIIVRICEDYSELAISTYNCTLVQHPILFELLTMGLFSKAHLSQSSP